MSQQTLIKEISKSDGSFGFSLLGKFAGIPHVIYDVIEDSPAAECEVRRRESCTNPFNFFPSERRVFIVFRCVHLISD